MMFSSLCTVCNYKNTSNVDQYNLVSDWLNDTISLKNMLNEKQISPAPNIPFTCMLQLVNNKIIYCYEHRVVKQDRTSLQQRCQLRFNNLSTLFEAKYLCYQPYLNIIKIPTRVSGYHTPTHMKCRVAFIFTPFKVMKDKTIKHSLGS